MTATKRLTVRRAAPADVRRPLLFTVEVGDIKKFAADVVALKYAQDFYGADEAVALALARGGISKTALRPEVGKHVFVETKGSIAAPHALFVGVPPLWELSYKHVRSLSAHALSALAAEEPDARSFAMTVHGVNTGLDEVEAALAQFGGFLDSMRAGRFPPALEKISIIDRDERCVERLHAAFAQAFKIADYATRASGTGWAYRLRVAPARGGSKKKKAQLSKKVQSPAAHRAVAAAAVIEKAGTTAQAKPHVFVAMPFERGMKDVFIYGIQKSVHAIDYLCERLDEQAFTGDILERIKKKIETASLVIADLTGDNPNVFLEVGYAWGKGRRTLLVVRDEPNKALRFDVQGQRCIKYEDINSLETELTRMLRELRKDGSI